MRPEAVREIQRRLRLWRQQVKARDGISAGAFAAKAELGPSTIKELLRSRPAKFNPSLDTINKYLNACDRNLGELFDFLASPVDDEARQLLSLAKHDPTLRHMYEAMVKMMRAGGQQLR